MTRLTHDKLTAIAARAAARPDTSDVRFAISQPSTGLEWSWAEDGAPDRYFIASITKLFTTAIVFQHVDESRYALDTPARSLLPVGTLDGLVAPEDVDAVTVAHLLSHTSGIRDYFEAKRPDGTVLLDQLLESDAAWSPSDALDMVRGGAPLGPPGASVRAHYSDTNFQLLGMIIEGADGRPFAESVAARIASPLGLPATTVFTPADVSSVDQIARIHHGRTPFAVPRAMASFGPDGGMVSSARDQLAFLRAFMGAELFSRPLLEAATTNWRRMFFPLEYGTGVMRYALPRAMNPFSPQPPMIGHSGASGAVLFYAPDRDLYVAGTVNQLKNRGLVYRVMSQLVRAAR